MIRILKNYDLFAPPQLELFDLPKPKRKAKGLTAMLLVIDNYDSFTFNLVQYLGEENVDMQVHRNDEITLEKWRRYNPSASSSLPALHAARGGLSMRSSNISARSCR